MQRGIGMAIHGSVPDMGMAMQGMRMGMAMQGTCMGMGMGMSEASHSIQQQDIYEEQLIREQLVELARVGGGSYEVVLAALGSSTGPITPSGEM
ncbi:hypothetical protein KI387_004782, partial [Taxus chinensis]